MSLSVTSKHIENYTSWLVLQKYQTNTIRNYLLDLKIFFQQNNNTLSEETITTYISSNSGQNNNSRHLASISKFCQFATDQQLISHNYFSLAKKHAISPSPTKDLDLLLTQFTQKLAREHKSTNTIRSYVADIRQYIQFCESQTF